MASKSNLNITEEQLNKLAVQEDGHALCYVENQTDDICKLAVRQNGYALQYVEIQTDDICKLAVQQNGCALYYVEIQTDDICKLAVQQNGLALQYVENQTEEIYELAIQQNPQALEWVDIMILQPLKWETINRLFDSNKDNTCSISYDNIELNDNYCICLTCSNSFKADVLIKWVEKNKTCPMCRASWPITNYTIYNNINN